MDSYVKDDFRHIQRFLSKEIFNKDLLTEDIVTQLRKIHRASYVYLQWLVELKRIKGIEEACLKEIFSVLVQITHISVFKDIKLTYMLLRDIIENFFKYSKDFFKISNTKYLNELYEQIKKTGSVKQNTILHSTYVRIWNKYQHASNYVHSSSASFMSLNKSLKEYIPNKVNEEFEKAVNNVMQLLKEINYIFILVHPEVYNGMESIKRMIIDAFCDKKILQDIYFYYFGVKYR